MKKEDKDLLLKDLCARMPYDVLVRRYVYTTPTNAIESVELFDTLWLEELYAEEAEFKPYLFPLSSMTDEQKEEWRGIRWSKLPWEELEWLNKNHFDYRGLIEKSLALDATGLNIY